MRFALRSHKLSVGCLALTLLVVAGGSAQAGVMAHRAGGSTFTIFMAEASTGPNSTHSAINYPPMEIACNEINQAGGVLGKKCVAIAVDTAGDAADADPRMTSAIAKASNPAAVIGIDSTVGPALVPLVTGMHMLAFSHAGEQQFFNYSNPKYLYMLQPPDEETGFGIAFAAAKLGYKHPAIVMTNTPDTAPITAGTLIALKALKISPAINMQVAPSQSSYATEAARVIASHPDSLLIELDPQTAGSFFQSMETELGAKFKLPIFTDDNGTVGPWRTAVDAAIGAKTLQSLEYVTTPATNSTASAGYKILANNFYKYPGTKGNPLSVFFSGPLYDAPIMTALAILEAKSFNPSVYSPYVYKLGVRQPGATEVQTFAQGKAAIAAGKKIYYFGANGDFGWTPTHSIIQPVLVFKIDQNGNSLPTLRTISISEIKQGLGIH